MQLLIQLLPSLEKIWRNLCAKDANRSNSHLDIFKLSVQDNPSSCQIAFPTVDSGNSTMRRFKQLESAAGHHRWLLIRLDITTHERSLPGCIEVNGTAPSPVWTHIEEDLGDDVFLAQVICDHRTPLASGDIQVSGVPFDVSDVIITASVHRGSQRIDVLASVWILHEEVFAADKLTDVVHWIWVWWDPAELQCC